MDSETFSPRARKSGSGDLKFIVISYVFGSSIYVFGFFILSKMNDWLENLIIVTCCSLGRVNCCLKVTWQFQFGISNIDTAEQEPSLKEDHEQYSQPS